MKVRVAELSAEAFEVTAESSGTSLRVEGTQPTELLLASVASCSVMDVRHILERGQQTVASLTVTIDGTQHDGVPATFRALHLDFTARGDALDEHKVQRAVQLSVEKYCPVMRSLDPRITVTWSAVTNP